MTISTDRLIAYALGILLLVVGMIHFWPSEPTVPLSQLRAAERKATADIAAAELHGHGTGWNDFDAFITGKFNEHISTESDKGSESGRKAVADLRDDVKRTIGGH